MRRDIGRLTFQISARSSLPLAFHLPFLPQFPSDVAGLSSGSMPTLDSSLYAYEKEIKGQSAAAATRKELFVQTRDASSNDAPLLELC